MTFRPRLWHSFITKSMPRRMVALYDAGPVCISQPGVMECAQTRMTFMPAATP